MKDIVFISQVLVLLLNVITFVYLWEQKVNYKVVRIVVLITFTIGLITTFGQTTWFSILFSFTPALSLIKFEDGNIGRISKKLWTYFRRNKQHLESLQRSDKTLSEQT